MRQRLNPWAVILTAALTFGSLMAFVGPHSYGYRGWGHHGYYEQHYWYNRGGCDAHHADKPADKSGSSQPR
ncbi:hypothetical protein GO730_03175 [Spirosoma sp. HMF3257]|uniref:hypothetical protein n=1 Tax=Spirosoma telluris TaxID=2183553 RepID=UPI000DAF2085|nr:hypothetical protein [Spirosoma telluris]